jgi:hypothetical protein
MLYNMFCIMRRVKLFPEYCYNFKNISLLKNSAANLYYTEISL